MAIYYHNIYVNAEPSTELAWHMHTDRQTDGDTVVDVQSAMRQLRFNKTVNAMKISV